VNDSIKQILVDRGERYGPFIGHAKIAQQLKTVIKEALELRHKSLADDQQEGLEMICHKIARIVNGDSNYIDSWLDISGYAQLITNRLIKELK
jgi:hypothetical protein